MIRKLNNLRIQSRNPAGEKYTTFTTKNVSINPTANVKGVCCSYRDIRVKDTHKNRKVNKHKHKKVLELKRYWSYRD